MKSREVTQKQVDQLINDAAYLQKEAEALKYVIEEVPYDAEPPEGYSIADTLKLMDHAQCNYYHPIVNEVINSKRPAHLNNYEDYKNTFTPKNVEESIQEILDALATHRASLVNKLKNISLITWGKVNYKNNREILLIDIIKQMNHDDQIHLKKITNLVKSHHQEKSTQRDVKQRERRQDIENKKG